MATKTKAQKAGEIAQYAADLADCIDALTTKSIQMIDSDDERNSGSQLIYAAGALAQQVGWLCDRVAGILEDRDYVIKDGAEAWMLPPSCKD